MSRFITILTLAGVVALSAGCHKNKKPTTTPEPIAPAAEPAPAPEGPAPVLGPTP